MTKVDNALAHSDKKKGYHTPELRKFGRVRELTTGGSTMRTENTGMGNQRFRMP